MLLHIAKNTITHLKWIVFKKSIKLMRQKIKKKKTVSKILSKFKVPLDKIYIFCVIYISYPYLKISINNNVKL